MYNVDVKIDQNNGPQTWQINEIIIIILNVYSLTFEMRSFLNILIILYWFFKFFFLSISLIHINKSVHVCSQNFIWENDISHLSKLMKIRFSSLLLR